MLVVFIVGLVVVVFIVYIMNKKKRDIHSYSVPTPSSDACVTFTCTTHKRLGSFKKTFQSLLKYMKDLHLVKSWVIIDDMSTMDDRIEMQHLCPFATFIGKGDAYRKQPHSLNMILKLVETPYVLQWEDDCQLTRDISLQMLVDLAKGGSYHQVSLNPWTDNTNYICTDKQHKDLSYTDIRVKDQEIATLKKMGIKEYISSDHYWRTNVISWPLYSLQPALNDVQFLKSLPHYSTDPSKNMKPFYYQFELEFASGFLLAGGKKASLRGEYFSSTGDDSTY
jgi:hypothetical protein